MGYQEDDLEKEAAASDLIAQERAAAQPRKAGRVSPGFVRAVHPDHGEPVLYTPGEMLPEWVTQALNAGHGHYDAETGVFELGAPPPVVKRTGRRAS